MPTDLLLPGIAVAALVLAWIFLRRAPKVAPMLVEPTEEARAMKLARQLSRGIGCKPADVLSAVEREIDYAPHQSDETLLKRAKYHYQQDLPEKTCNLYQDKARG